MTNPCHLVVDELGYSVKSYCYQLHIKHIFMKACKFWWYFCNNIVNNPWFNIIFIYIFSKSTGSWVCCVSYHNLGCKYVKTKVLFNKIDTFLSFKEPYSLYILTLKSLESLASLALWVLHNCETKEICKTARPTNQLGSLIPPANCRVH